jgi:PAS domain-containing protein
MIADGLGTGVAAPACIAILRTSLRVSRGSVQNWLYLLVVLAASVLVFSRTDVPMAFILYPLLILVLLRLGLGWAAISTFLIAAVASWYSAHGQGPFVSLSSHTAIPRVMVLQIFIGSAIFMLYSVSMVLEGRKLTERRLQRIATLHKLVTDNSRDAIILADFNGYRSHVSSAVEAMTGWTPQEVVRQTTS